MAHSIHYFLAKTDPDTYSADQLERDGQTVWDGVKNPQALRAIGQMKAGDRVLIYHSMAKGADGPALVAVADVVSDAYPNPADSKLAVAVFRFRARIEPPVTLKEVKDSGRFGDWALVRQSRLSTMTAPPEAIDWLRSIRAGIDL